MSWVTEHHRRVHSNKHTIRKTWNIHAGITQGKKAQQNVTVKGSDEVFNAALEVLLHVFAVFRFIQGPPVLDCFEDWDDTAEGIFYRFQETLSGIHHWKKDLLFARDYLEFKSLNVNTVKLMSEIKDGLTAWMFSGVKGTSGLIRVKKQQMPVRAVSGGLATKSLMVLSPSTIPGYVCLHAESKFTWP